MHHVWCAVWRLQVGDGTTTVVLLAGEFLREAKPFIEEGVHPQLIIRAFRTAAHLVRRSCTTSANEANVDSGIASTPEVGHMSSGQ